MAGDNEFRFRITAYTPATMPLGRLAEYLSELAKVLGEDQAVHLVELDEGSTVLVHKIDDEAVPKIRDRAAAVQDGTAPAEAMRSYQRVNRMLRDDNGAAALMEGIAEILEFPGNRVAAPPFMTVSERAEIDGEVVRVGGVGDPVPVLLSTEGQTVSGCWAKRSVAKPLAQRLFEPVRLFGEGRWTRSPVGDWTLAAFRIDSFKELEDEPLSETVNKLRAVPGLAFGDNIVEELLAERHGDEANGGV
jgi:hypothetical protein